MSQFEQANVRVTEAVYRFDRAIAEAIRAAEELEGAEQQLSMHADCSHDERGVACRGTGSARVALAVLQALEGGPEGRPVHVPTPARATAATDLSDCACAIPAKPPSDHGRNCPVFLRWAAAAGAAGAVIGTSPTLSEVDSANTLIVSHKMPWCRARLLHALGAAEEQGVLDDVLRELIEDESSVSRLDEGDRARCLLRAVLTARGWVGGGRAWSPK